MAQRSEQRGRQEPLASEPTPKRVRARIGSTMIADSRRARIVRVGRLPRTYAVPVEDVREGAVSRQHEAREHPRYGRVRVGDVDVDGRRVSGAVLFPEGDAAAEAGLDGCVILAWDRFDQWYEEDEAVHIHPRDPHHRIDVLQSSRHVVVEVDGERVAETWRPMLLLETGLPVRYYMPEPDVRLDLLRESGTRTGCPYKGWATYHHVDVGGRVHEDIVWSYRTTLPDGDRVRGLLAFFDERVDVTVDGERQERPETVWGRPPGR